MDYIACLKRIAESIQYAEYNDAQEAMEDLAAWISKGGVFTLDTADSRNDLRYILQKMAERLRN